MVAQILTCCDLRFIGALNRLKIEETKNLPSEELGINTPEGRPYVMVTLMSKARLKYEEAIKTEPPEQIAWFHKLLKKDGLEIPEKPTKVLSWKLTEAEEKVLHEVGASETPLTIEELVKKTLLTKKICYKSAEALVKLEEIYLWDGDKYPDAQPRYGFCKPNVVIDESITGELFDEAFKRWQIGNPSISQQCKRLASLP